MKQGEQLDFNPQTILTNLNNRREGEKTIAYAESHDQCLQGDKTIIMHLFNEHGKN